MNKRPFFLFVLFITTLLCYSFNKDSVEVVVNDPFVVVLDAGHGGHDPGNLGNGYLEKNIALNIILEIGKILESDPAFKVIYTRKDDTFVDLYVRGEIANKADADLFVSVHCDSHTSDAYGAGTFVLGLHANKQNFEIAKKENSVIYLEDNYQERYAEYDINSPEKVIGLTIMQEEFLDQSIQLATVIQDNFTNKLKRHDRKVKQAGFIVLHQTFMPSVLIETGFLTNDKEGAYLNSTRGQIEMGTTIADAVQSYRNQLMGELPDTQKSNDVAPFYAPPKATPEPEEVSIANEAPSEKEKTPIVEVMEPEEEATEMMPPTIEEPIKKVTETIVQQETIEAMETEDVETPIPPVAEEPLSEAPVVEVPVVEAPVVTKEPKATKPNITFKVQIMASAKKFALEAGYFRGLNTLSKERFKNFYRYMYGNASTLEEAKLLKSNADLKGYNTSFIVAYKDGERVTIKEALKYVSE